MSFEVVKAQPGEAITLDGFNFAGELRPTKLWVLPHGSKEDRVSYAWELSDLNGNVFVAQITDEMLRRGLEIAGELAFLRNQ